MVSVFGANMTTPTTIGSESHILKSSSFVPHQGGVCDVNAAKSALTVRCIMMPECGNGDELTYAIVENVRDSFEHNVMGAFPQAKVESAADWHVTLFTDNSLGKYQPDALKATQSTLV